MGNIQEGVYAFGNSKEEALDSLNCQLRVVYGINLNVETYRTKTNDRAKRTITCNVYYTRYQSNTKKYCHFKKHVDVNAETIWEVHVIL